MGDRRALCCTSRVLSPKDFIHAIMANPRTFAPEITELWLQIFNGIALLVISQHPRFGVHKFAGPAVGIGAVLFSGSIFLLTFTRER